MSNTHKVAETMNFARNQGLAFTFRTNAFEFDFSARIRFLIDAEKSKCGSQALAPFCYSTAAVTLYTESALLHEM